MYAAEEKQFASQLPCPCLVILHRGNNAISSRFGPTYFLLPFLSISPAKKVSWLKMSHASIYSMKECNSIDVAGFAFRSTSSYRCLKNQECIITQRTRKSCQFCRFKKCERVGMRRNWVLVATPAGDDPSPAAHTTPTKKVPINSVTPQKAVGSSKGRELQDKRIFICEN